ncbi:MAG: hypothetical protein COA80_08505 [Leeuwenhoekiella sp.]|nr:MAG: hypothetical protein COA80_08505 [Leeuwenhoekiella sp.]
MNTINMRAKQIKSMILEMAQGNFNYSIPRTDDDSEAEAIAALLNMLAQELKASYNPFVFNAPALSIFSVNHYLFLINPNNLILSTNFELDTATNLENQNFAHLLTPSSQKTFKKSLKSLQKQSQPSCPCKLELLTKDELLVPLDCTLFRLRYEAVVGNYLVVASRIQSHNPLKREHVEIEDYPVRKLEALKSSEDILNIQQVEAYLRNYPEERLKSLKLLALRFGLNEFKLKKGFKELYQTTVFRYQMQQRLLKASHLIYSTNDKLSCIATKTGFKNYVHFAQVFKKEYGVAPSYYRKMRK